MRLRVDVEAARVQIGTVELGGQWVDFYALLALARTERVHPRAYVTAEEVARVGPWRHKAIASVGKEVARHMHRLGREGMSDVVQCLGRTRAWRLGIGARHLRFHPGRDAVEAWTHARSSNTVREFGAADLRALIEATIALQRGDAQATVSSLEGGSRLDAHDALASWSALLRGRAAHQLDEEDLLDELAEKWSGRMDAPGRAVGARLRALVAYRHRFEDPSSSLASLGKLAARLELGGDISTLGAVVNVMGLLARRAGDPEAAAAHHLRAAAIFGMVGDYFSLEGAIFNIALCRREVLGRAGRVPDEDLLALLDLCRLIDARFGVGGDSAQVETTGAQWACEMGDMERARSYLAEAEKRVRSIESTFEQAYFLATRARIELARPDGTGNPVRDLRAAERLFTEIGDELSAKNMRGMLDAIAR
ncbi:hypothetical protein [Polyangium aurulentum]|uniref:hypothetical protein n=1 Tax=Polyangium aurulentum TaxID=2567896 RepID=UPI0010AEEA0B|nr:hypothetical protein [Polyangium aurulentum]UQA59015.1 hypothetical protein E8A73_000395 [Polyangium aurulentum]